MKILIIDNYDSFVYNIAHLFGKISVSPKVVRNDKLSLSDIVNYNPDAIVISPGPGNPEDKRYFGICEDVILNLGPSIPILGICLGHQGIASAFGGKVCNAHNIRHGKTSMIKYDDNDPLFRSLPNPFRATRYHSLIANKNEIPKDLEITAFSIDDNEIMGLRHKRYLIEGIQFHPESILTESGMQIIRNFVDMIKK